MFGIATEMQTDVKMTSRIVYFRYISLFGKNFTEIRYIFDEKPFFFKKNGLKRYRNNHFRIQKGFCQ